MATLTLLCGCGVTVEGDVHRPGCDVYLNDPRIVGPLECQDCGGKVNALRNGRCGVCDYWFERGRKAS